MTIGKLSNGDIMALPKLNDQPKYDLVIPSTQQSVKYRPFLVKEEKVLLLAMESNDQKQILNAIVDTIEACVADDINRTKLTTFDVEYMFLQLRSKSVGEVSELKLACTKCEHLNDYKVALDTINIEMPDVNKMVTISDDIKLELQYPSFSTVMNDKDILGENQSKATFAMIKACMKTVFTEDEVMELSEYSTEEVDDFLNSMNTEQFNAMKEFMDTLPKLQKDVEFTCERCNHENKLVLEGMQSFF